MRPLKLIVVAALLGVGYYQWQTNSYAPMASANAAQAGLRGFIAVPAFDGIGGNAVTIVTSDDAPEGTALRAQRFAQVLRAQGIPIVVQEPVRVAAAGYDRAVAERLAAIKAGDQPLVVIRGKAKSNPAPEGAILEYMTR